MNPYGILKARYQEEIEKHGKSLNRIFHFKRDVESKDKEIQDLKKQALTWGEHARESQKAAREIEREFEKSQAAHEKQVHHMDGEINRQINKVASAEKKRDALEKQLDKTKSNYLFQISEQDNEIEKLNERLARIEEALKKSNWMLDATPLDMRTVEDEELCFNENKNALSSYDPKWIAGVRADVWRKAAGFQCTRCMAGVPVSFVGSKRSEGAFWIHDDGRSCRAGAYMDEIKNISQPNQSRETSCPNIKIENPNKAWSPCVGSDCKDKSHTKKPEREERG